MDATTKTIVQQDQQPVAKDTPTQKLAGTEEASAPMGTATHLPGQDSRPTMPVKQAASSSESIHIASTHAGIPLVDTIPISKEAMPITTASQLLNGDSRPPMSIHIPVAASAPVDMLMPPIQNNVVLTSNTQKTEGPHILQLSATDISRSRAQLLAKISTDLREHNISTQVDNEAGTIYLPILMEFESNNTQLNWKKRRELRKLANVLADNLFCFSRDANKAEECAGIAGAVKLDALVIVGNSSPKPIGTKAFRKSWDLANTRALTTFETLLKSHPRMSGLRNTHDQSIFRLDGFLPPGGKNDSRPTRRVELRLIMEPSPLESKPNP